MEKERNTPSIRFKEFTGSWEQRKLKDIVSFYSGLTYKPDDVQDSGTLVLRSSNVKDGEVLTNDNVYVDPKKVNSENVQPRDLIVVVRNGSRSLIGKHAQIKAIMPNTVIGAFMTGIRSNHAEFVNALLDTPNFKKKVDMNMGATINQITGYMFSQMEFMIPADEEMECIGTFFKGLDKLIVFHQRKLDQGKKLKKYLLQNMFPREGENVPRIRFPGFTDPWEQRKLGELGEIITGSTPSTSHPEYYSDDGIPWVTPTDINKNIIYATPRKLSKAGQAVGRVVPKDSILVTCIASIGKNTMLGVTGSFNQQINGLVPDLKEYDPYFLFAESTIWSKVMKRRAASGTMQIVNKAEFSDIVTMVPRLNEQQQISNLFTKLDNLITLHQRKLESLKTLKRGLLQKMFI